MEEGGGERKATAGVTESGQRICTYYMKEQRADGSCSFMDAHGSCQFAHIDKAGRAVKEGPKIRDGTEARQAGKRARDESGGSAGEKRPRHV